MTHEIKTQVKNPFYRVTLTKDEVSKTWLFLHGDKDWAIALYSRFKAEGFDVRIYSREWVEFTEDI